MAEIPISLTCADYARVMPLATGQVKPEGIALTMILGNRGSWPARAEMLRRAVQDPDVQGGEWSMAQYLYRIEKGDRRYVGLPVFPLRTVTARDLYIRRAGSIAVRHADRRRARRDLQPAASAGVPPEVRTDRARVPGLPLHRAGILSQDRRVPPAAPDRDPARDVGKESVDCQERDRCVHRGQ